jgi:hypothetical protein
MNVFQLFGSGLVAALVCGACSSGGAKGGVLGVPERFTGFPGQAQSDLVYAEARFYVNHEDIFDEDLIDEEGIVPIGLRIGLRGEGQNETKIHVSPEDMELTLYLADGTALRSVPYSRFKPDRNSTANRVIEQALKPTLLEPWERSKEGFVFFKLGKGDAYDAEKQMIVHKQGDVTRRLGLWTSLCTFKVTTDNRLEPFYVGVQADRRAKRN